MTWLISYLDKAGAVRSCFTYSWDKPYRVRLHFLQDYPAAVEILYFGLAQH